MVFSSILTVSCLKREKRCQVTIQTDFSIKLENFLDSKYVKTIPLKRSTVGWSRQKMKGSGALKVSIINGGIASITKETKTMDSTRDWDN